VVSHVNWVASRFPGYNHPVLGKSAYALLAAVVTIAFILLVWLSELFGYATYRRRKRR
jgi:hypothetical protein